MRLQQVYEFKTRVWEAYRGKPISFWILLFLSSAAMLVAFPASTLVTRLYYANGGRSKWVISWVAAAGWPLTAFPLLFTYSFLNKLPTPFNFKLTASYSVLGFLSAADNLLYAYAYAYLPPSTASLLASSSLVFAALFAHLLARNHMNASVVNSLVIITAALTIIALDSDSDRYHSVSRVQYAMGFVLDVLGSALHGLIFALSELLFVKLLGRVSFHVVLEQQVVVSLFAFIFTTIGLIVNKSFPEMESTAANYKGGRVSYYMTLIWAALTFQLGVLGSTALVFLTSTMFAGVLNAIRVPITSIAAVILLNDPMSGFKILSLILTFWGFCSYIYGNSQVPHRIPSQSAV